MQADEAEALALCVLHCVIGHLPADEQLEVRRRIARRLFTANVAERRALVEAEHVRRHPKDYR